MSEKKARIRKPVESPRNPFDAAKIIHKALNNLSWNDKIKAARWAMEECGLNYPVRVQGGATYP